MTEVSKTEVIETKRKFDAEQDEVFSFYALGVFVLRNWRPLAFSALLGAVLGILTVQFRPLQYPAKTSFVLVGASEEKLGLGGLAGQLGLAFPSGGALQSPQFYADLATTHEFLLPVASDTFSIAALGLRGARYGSIVGVIDPESGLGDEMAVDELRKSVSVSVTRQTGVVQISVTTPWRDLSVAIAQRLLDHINQFNLRNRQIRATAERRFTEDRLAAAKADVVEAEGRLQVFLQKNRLLNSSAELTFDRERLQRDLDFKRQIATTLAQADVENRLRELRNVPAISTVEAPWVTAIPNSRGRTVRAALGLSIGILLTVIILLARDAMRLNSISDDPIAKEFFSMLRERSSSPLQD